MGAVAADWPAIRAAARHALLVLAACLVAALVAAWLPVRAADLVKGLAVLVAGLALIRAAGIFLFRFLVRAARVRAPRIVEDISFTAAYVVWGALQLRLAGMDLASLVTTSAVITAVLAFAMQDTLGNTLGGLFIEIDQSIAIGDWIKVDDLSGRVAEIRWRHTALRTRNGDLVVIPNASLMKSRFTVIGNPDVEEVRWRRWIWFDVDFDVPAARVIAAAEQAIAAAEIDHVLREPRPDCVLMSLELGQNRDALRYWLSDPRRDDGTDSAVRVHLLAALERSGIALSLPKQLGVGLKEAEERQLARRARDIEAGVTTLGRIDLFAPLSPPELRSLAMHLVHAPFAAGDVITRQGAVAHWLYILIEGEAEVWVEAPDAPRRRVAALGPGDVFGEMGMMTGEPRRATVLAKTDAECYRLDKAGFEDILRARPAIAGAMSRVLASRASVLRQAIAEAEQAGAALRVQPEPLLQRICAFFGLEDAGEAGVRVKPPSAAAS